MTVKREKKHSEAPFWCFGYFFFVCYEKLPRYPFYPKLTIYYEYLLCTENVLWSIKKYKIYIVNVYLEHILNTAQKMSFSFRISLVNVIKSLSNSRFGDIYRRNLKWKTSFFMQNKLCTNVLLNYTFLKSLLKRGIILNYLKYTPNDILGIFLKNISSALLTSFPKPRKYT